MEVNLVKVPHFYGSFEVELQSNQDDLTENNNQIIHFRGGELTKKIKIQIYNETNNFKIQLKDPTNKIALGEKSVIDIAFVGKFSKSFINRVTQIKFFLFQMALFLKSSIFDPKFLKPKLV